MKILLSAPLYLTCEKHVELMKGMCESAKSKHEIYKLGIENKITQDKGAALMGFDKIIMNDENCVARAWNIAIRYAFESVNNFDYLLIANTDIIFRDDTIDNLIEYAETTPDGIVWSARSWGSNLGTIAGFKTMEVKKGAAHQGGEFGLFSVNKNILKMSFDDPITEKKMIFNENFKPAYYEDCDMIRRIKLKEEKMYHCLWSIYWHYVSQTIGNDQELQREVSRKLNLNQDLYFRMWGGPPNYEKYKTIFNE